MILFLAHTPMQLMNSVILAQTALMAENCDLYYTENIAAAANKAAEKGVFSSVHQISLTTSTGSSLQKMCTRIRNALEIGQIRKDLPTDPNRYERVFLSGITLRNIEFYYAMKSVNPDLQLSLYEEGVCEYYYMAKKSYGKILFSKCFFRRFYLQDCDSLFVHNPEFVELAWDHIIVKEIPSVQNNPALIRLLNDLMGYQNCKLAGCEGKIVFLEQALYDSDMEIRQKEALETIAKVVGKENVVIKLHPRSQTEKYGNDYKYLNISCPFEIVAMNEPTDTMTFVSLGSSALLNFKLMLNQEPRIISLNAMFADRTKTPTEFDKLLYRVQKKCDAERFLMPETLEKLASIIKEHGEIAEAHDA